MVHESNASLVTIDSSAPPTSRRLKRELGWASDFSFSKRRAVASASPPTPSPRTTTDGLEFNQLPRPRAQPLLHRSSDSLQTINEDGLPYEAKEESADFAQVGYSYSPHPMNMMSSLHHQPRPSPKPKKHPKPEALDLTHRATDPRWSLHPGTPKKSPDTPGTIHPELAQLREHLRSLGSVYLGNLEAADVYVQAVALRRNWTPTSPVKEEKREADDHPPATADRPEFGEEIVVRARVRPRDDRRKPFVIQRKFNLAEMRATIPDPTSEGCTLQRRSSIAELGNTRPYTPTTTPCTKPLIGRDRRRSTSVRFGPLSPASPRTRRGPIGAGAELKLPPRNSNNLMPIHLEYARSYLPVLAALLLSGYIREGDIVDMPVPHPAAWPQTVAHVYTGKGELTEAVKENIRYLGGRI